MIKKITAAILALTLVTCTTCSLAGCNKKSDSNNSNSSSADNSSAENSDSSLDTFDPDSVSEQGKVADPSLTLGDKVIDVSKDFTVCTIDGVKINFDTFRFYYYSTLTNYQQYYGVDMDTIKNTDGAFDAFIKDVMSSVKQKVLLEQLAKENKCELTDKEKKEKVTDTLSSIKSQFTDENEFQEALKQQYHTEKTYKEFLTTQALYNNVTENVFKNEGKYATKYDEFRKIIQDSKQYAHEINIIIPYYSMVDLSGSDASGYDSMSLSEKMNAKYSAYSQLDEEGQRKAKESAKKKAEEVLKKAQDGEDFTKLMEEYSWDENTDGYYINKENASQQGYPEDLIKTVFELKENEISKSLIEDDDAGFVIAKRVPVDMEYVNKNINDLCYSYDSPKISEKMKTLMDKMKVTYCDDWDKLTADSIT